MAGTVVTFLPGRLRGRISVPGDKSISHRALIAGACGSEPLHIARLNPGRDVRATREALAAMGARIQTDGDLISVRAQGLSPPGVLDCMNSGSTARMLLGVCAGANLPAQFDGDASLRRRPMEPVAAQLRAFGARIETTDGHLPLKLLGTPEIQTRRFILLAPSAQVKSALLFAGLFGGVQVQIDGDHGSRDHTERLLRHLGADIEWNARSVRLAGTGPLRGGSVEIAGDFSSAAFFIAAAAITPGSAIMVQNVGVNPTRTGLLDALRAMGTLIDVRDSRLRSGEPVADVAVEYRALTATKIGADLALRAIDEIPLLAIAAAFAQGTTRITGVADLRSKESDRIAAIARLLEMVGIEAIVEPQGLAVLGGAPRARAGVLETHDDHRIAMAAAVLGCVAGPLSIDSDASLEVSFPGFLAALRRLRGG